MSDAIVSPPGASSTGPAQNEDDALLNDEVEVGEGEEEEESSDEEEESSEEEEEPDEEEEEPSGEEEEELPKLSFNRPTLRDIKAKYPEFFKDFPAMRDAFFREAEFTSLFPTVEDAKEAFEDNTAFNGLREAALAGDPKPILDSIASVDKAALISFAGEFMPTLYKMDQAVYSEVVTPLFENLVRHAYKQGVAKSDDNLKNAALQISVLLFDTEEVAEGKKTMSKQEQRSEETRRARIQKEAEAVKVRSTAVDHVVQNIDKQMRVLVLKDFDPDNVFSPFLRKNLANEVISRIKKQLNADKGHMSVMNARWERAKINGYTDADKGKIVTAFLARAKSMIPSVREKVRSEALGTKKRNSENQMRRGAPARRELTGGRAPGGVRRERGGTGSGKVDYSKMSDMDILNAE